jgi:hypothetical protein
MDNLTAQFRKASLTLVDRLLLALCALALTYLSVPLVVKVSIALSRAGEPDPHADIQIIGVLVFLGAFLFAISAVFCASLGIGVLIFSISPNRVRWITRIAIMAVFLPVFLETVKRGPQGYFNWRLNPSIRQNEAKQKAQSELERKLKMSQALSLEEERDGVQITNNTDQLVRLQVTFTKRVNNEYILCYPGESATFPPSPSDEEMNLPPRESRRYVFTTAHTNTGSSRDCGFDQYAVWGWDENSVPLYLSQKAHLF